MQHNNPFREVTRHFWCIRKIPSANWQPWIPWAKVEQKYTANFKNLRSGQTAYSVRMVLGALIIQSRKYLSDRDTVQKITETPYLQYFVGVSSFIEEPPFDALLMVHFWKDLSKDIINEANEMIGKEAAKPDDNDDNHSGKSQLDVAQTAENVSNQKVSN